jgi:hypothetical protein
MSLARRELLKGGLSLAAGAVGWLTVGPRWLGSAPDREGPVPDWVEGLANTCLSPWEGGDRSALIAAHRANPEYDLMARMFLALALADLALRDPDRWRVRALAALDAIGDHTRDAIAVRGQEHFLLGYGHGGGWRGDGRSLFVDGEQLMIEAVRLLVADDSVRRGNACDLADHVASSLLAGPIHAAESYPNECWIFCNTLAIAALGVLGAGRGDPWHAARTAFLDEAKARLLDPSTGMLVSSFSWEGHAEDGPEGSTLWPAVHFLRAVDEPFAAEQYALARTAIGRSVLGFGWSREWQTDDHGLGDIDSGPIVPGLGASASASGMAILAARSHGDEAYARSLLAALEVAGMPRTSDGRRSYAASNAVGDAVLLASLTTGPAWDHLSERRA